MPVEEKDGMTKIGKDWVFSERTFDLKLFLTRHITQQTFTCSKLKKEILEKDVKYVHDIVLVSLFLILNILHTFECFYCWLWTGRCLPWTVVFHSLYYFNTQGDKTDFQVNSMDTRQWCNTLEEILQKGNLDFSRNGIE